MKNEKRGFVEKIEWLAVKKIPLKELYKYIAEHALTTP